MRLCLLLIWSFLALSSRGAAQDYLLRPGPRGFDPRLNQYGATESPATTAVPRDRFNPSATTVRVELLMHHDGAGLAAQMWSRTLAEIGYPARVRRPLLNDKEEVSETNQGPLRFVTVVGSLDQRGNVVFPGRIFTPDQTAELKEWLDELKTYGAQGSPEGQPLWGLNRTQFEQVYAALAKPVAAEVAGMPLAEAIAKLGLPKEHPLKFSTAARSTLAEPDQPRGVSRSMAGLTLGTALAFCLNEYGLGFRPERTPQGTIELAIVPLPTSLPAGETNPQVVWPVGWNVEERPAPERRAAPVRDRDAVPPNRVQIAPELFTMTRIELVNVPLVEALAAAERQTGIPVLLDRRATAGLDLEQTRITVPPDRTSWSLALRAMTVPHRLRYELRHDEMGQPIVWITSLRRGR